jgi:hypothetical protein
MWCILNVFTTNMEGVLAFFNKEKVSTPTAEWTGQQTMFKSNFKLYIIKPLKSELTLWAHCLKTETDYYLGRFNGKSIVMADKFYNLPWDVQKGAERLFKLINNR